MKRCAILFLLLCSCLPQTKTASTPKPVGKPAWFPTGDSLTYPSESYLVGVASCGPESRLEDRANCATQKATEQIVLQIKAQVSVAIEREDKQNISVNAAGRVATLESSYQRKGSVEAALSLENVQPTQQSCTTEERCYSLVAIPRSDMAGRLRAKLTNQKDSLSQLLDLPATTDLLTALSRLHRASQLAVEIDSHSYLLSVLERSYSQTNTTLQVEQVRSKLLSSAEACLFSNNPEIATEVVFSEVRSELVSLGFPTVQLATQAQCGTASLWIGLEATLQTRAATGPQAGLQVVELSGKLSLGSSGATLGGAKSLLSRGVAKDTNKARQDAENQLAQMIAQELQLALDEEKP